MAAGYEVTRQNFLFNSFQELSEPVFEQVEPNQVTYVPDEDFITMDYSGSGDVTEPLQAVDLVLPPGADGQHVEQRLRDRGLRRLRRGQHRADPARDLRLRGQGRERL